MQSDTAAASSDELPTETEVLIHHSVSAVFGSDVCASLHTQLEDVLPPTVVVDAATTALESAAALETADVVLTIRPIADTLPADTAPDWVQTLNSGVDAYALDALADRGVAVTNAAGIAANPIAEQVLGYLLTFERRIHTGIRQQERDGLWQRYSAGELRGKTLGIVGVGAIGTRVAELAAAFEMEVIGTKRTPETAPSTVDEVHPPEGLPELLARSDYVVLACPLVEETRGLIDAEALMSMRSNAVLVNIARGPVVDESALEDALQQGRIRGAALDVFESEPLPPSSVLWDLPNVVITPHMAGSTPRYADRIASLVGENYAHYAAGEPEQFQNRVV